MSSLEVAVDDLVLLTDLDCQRQLGLRLWGKEKSPIAVQECVRERFLTVGGEKARLALRSALPCRSPDSKNFFRPLVALGVQSQKRKAEKVF